MVQGRFYDLNRDELLRTTVMKAREISRQNRPHFKDSPSAHYCARMNPYRIPRFFQILKAGMSSGDQTSLATRIYKTPTTNGYTNLHRASGSEATLWHSWKWIALVHNVPRILHRTAKNENENCWLFRIGQHWLREAHENCGASSWLLTLRRNTGVFGRRIEGVQRLQGKTEDNIGRRASGIKRRAT